MSYISTNVLSCFLPPQNVKNKSNNINNGCLGVCFLTHLKSSNQEKIKIKRKNKMICPTGPNSNSKEFWLKCSHKYFLF